jgi:saccharopine dehydrogenase (NADP+, L-glutamate forming)/spermidine synthase
VVLASRNSAKFLENGSVVDIEGKNLFLNKRLEEIEGLGTFEVYPNRDSLSYQEIYGLKDALTVMRGTYRNLGWCDTLKRIVDLGLVDETPVTGLNGVSYKKMMADLVGELETDDVQEKAAATLGLKRNDPPIIRLEWLGLFSEEKIPDISNRLDILCNRLEKKLKYTSGERDMLIMRHRFIVENKDKTEDCITSTLIDFGIPNGDSSMARTVSLPLAIAVKMMAEGSIKLTGVQIPITQAVYGPVLRELEKQKITLVEKRTRHPAPT